MLIVGMGKNRNQLAGHIKIMLVIEISKKKLTGGPY